MSLSYSYPFDFTRTPTFFNQWNLGSTGFSISQMNASNNYEFVFVSHCPENIEQCLDGGKLDTDAVNVLTTLPCSLKYDATANEVIISVRNQVTWNIGENIYDLKGVFLRSKDSSFVMGYSIKQNIVEVTNKLIIEADTILWSIT